jgi:small-conductance mechanosensitive channel
MSFIRALVDDPRALVIPLVSFGAVFLVGLALRSFLYRMLHRAAARTKSQIDDLIIGAHAAAFDLMDGGHRGSRGDRDLELEPTGHRLRAACSRCPDHGFHLPGGGERGRDCLPLLRQPVELAVTGLAETVIRVAIIVIGVVVALDVVGVDVTPMVTALGVGGLAVALGLQDTRGSVLSRLRSSETTLVSTK